VWFNVAVMLAIHDRGSYPYPLLCHCIPVLLITLILIKLLMLLLFSLCVLPSFVSCRLPQAAVASYNMIFVNYSNLSRKDPAQTRLLIHRRL